MPIRMARVICLLPILVAFTLTGCKGPPTVYPADPDAAKNALKQGLDAWKSGQTPGSDPKIQFADSQWSEGRKLVSYEIQGDGERNGFDWQCRVKLVLQDSKGQQQEERAIYNISTKPKVVVVRFEM